MPVKIPAVEPSAMLIVRLWIEGNLPAGLRARITQSLDSTALERTVDTASTPTQVNEIVRVWVKAFVDAQIGNNNSNYVDPHEA